MEIGIKGGDDLFTGNVVCNGHYFELACSVVYRRWDGRVTRTFSGICSEYVTRLEIRYRHTLYCSISRPVRIFTYVRLALDCRWQEFRATIIFRAI